MAARKQQVVHLEFERPIRHNIPQSLNEANKQLWSATVDEDAGIIGLRIKDGAAAGSYRLHVSRPVYYMVSAAAVKDE
jgi:hypothetical protein